MKKLLTRLYYRLKSRFWNGKWGRKIRIKRALNSDEFVNYCEQDAKVTHELYKHFNEFEEQENDVKSEAIL